MTHASSTDPGLGDRRDRPDRRDALVALLGSALLCALYLATYQARQYGDAPLLMQHFADSLEVTGYWGHVLYFPAGWALLPLVPTPIDALLVLSSLGGALASGCGYLLARAWGAGRAGACAGALLFAFSPGAWFFSTTIEVHALHAACVGVCALVTTLAPWRRPLVAAPLAAATLPLLFLSHQTGILLGPGFVLLAQAARVRSGAPPFSPARLWLLIAPLFLAAMLASVAIAAELLGRDSMLSLLRGSNQVVRDFVRESGLRSALDGWIQPLGAITPVFLGALALRRLHGWTLAAVLGLVLLPCAFVLAWGLAERGGYALPSLLFLAAAGAVVWRPASRAGKALAVLAVLAQVALGWAGLRSYDGPEWRERAESRADAVREVLPAGGVLVSINIHSQYIEFQVREARELSLYDAFTRAVSEGDTPEQFVQRARALVEPLFAAGEDVALDLDGLRFAVERQPRLAPLVDGLESWLRERCAFEPSASQPETIVRLRPR